MVHSCSIWALILQKAVLGFFTWWPLGPNEQPERTKPNSSEASVDNILWLEQIMAKGGFIGWRNRLYLLIMGKWQILWKLLPSAITVDFESLLVHLQISNVTLLLLLVSTNILQKTMFLFLFWKGITLYSSLLSWRKISIWHLIVINGYLLNKYINKWKYVGTEISYFT